VIAVSSGPETTVVRWLLINHTGWQGAAQHLNVSPGLPRSAAGNPAMKGIWKWQKR
jgi:hypothetical protein